VIWAQIKDGNKLHLACEPGEEYYGDIIRAGHLSAPLCHTRAFTGHYCMSINVPLGHACQNCVRIAESWEA